MRTNETIEDPAGRRPVLKSYRSSLLNGVRSFRISMILVALGAVVWLTVRAGRVWRRQDTAETEPPTTKTIALGGPVAESIAVVGTTVIDHNAVDAAVIPQTWLDQARGLSTLFNHKSVGNNILAGLADLQAQDPGRYSIHTQSSQGTSSGINHYQAGSNGAPLTKIDGFAPLVSDGHDLAMLKLCPGDCPCVQGDTPIDQVWTAYRDMMIAQQAAHPSTVLVWWTWPLIASNHSRAHCNEELAAFNDAVRAHVAANGGVLFDIADIESHDPGGSPVDYNGWEAAYPGYTSDGAHLNEIGRQRVASALWSLLAQVAGSGDHGFAVYLPTVIRSSAHGH